MIKYEKVKIASTLAGDIFIDVFNHSPENAKAKVALIGTIHGTESIGAKIIYKIIDNYKKIDVSFVAIPIANPLAASEKNNDIPPGYGSLFSGTNLNRKFAGGNDFGSKVAENIFNIIKKCDYLIDIHSGTIIGRIHPQVRIKTDHKETLEKSRMLARYSGIETIVETNSKDIGSGGILAKEASKYMPSITLELFGGYVSEEEIDFGYQSVINIFNGNITSNQTTYRKIQKIFSPSSGVLYFTKKLGGEIKEGEAYAYVRKENEKHPIISGWDGILGWRTSHGFCNEGDYIAEILTDREELTK